MEGLVFWTLNHSLVMGQQETTGAGVNRGEAEFRGWCVICRRVAGLDGCSST